MKNVRSKKHNRIRKILAVLVALAATGTVGAFAAGVDVTAALVGGGGASVTTCVPSAPGGVTTGYVIDEPTQKITGVVVTVYSDVSLLTASTACSNKWAHVSLFSTANDTTPIVGASGKTQLGGAASSVTVTLTTPANPSAVLYVKSTVTDS